MKQKEDAASMQMSRRKFEQLMGTEKRKRGKRKARQRKAKHGNANQQQACVKAQEKKRSLLGWEWDKAIGESVAMFVPVVSFDLWDKKCCLESNLFHVHDIGCPKCLFMNELGVFSGHPPIFGDPIILWMERINGIISLFMYIHSLRPTACCGDLYCKEHYP